MTKADLPKKIKVGPYSIKVKIVKNLKKIAKNNDTVGYFSPKDLVIYIQDGLEDSMQRETFTHELFHAIWLASGLTALDVKEELIVSILSPIFLDTLQRNKQLRESLMN